MYFMFFLVIFCMHVLVSFNTIYFEFILSTIMKHLYHFFPLYCWILFRNHNSTLVIKVFNVVKGLWIQKYRGTTSRIC